MVSLNLTIIAEAMEINEIKEMVKEVCGNFCVPNKKYHSPLIPELERWYAYFRDAGHSIICLLEQDYSDELEQNKLKGYLVPAPVKSVLKGYTIKRDFVVVNLPYSQKLGLITPTEDDEY